MLADSTGIDFHHHGLPHSEIGFNRRGHIANENREAAMLFGPGDSIAGDAELPGLCACVDTNRAILTGFLWPGECDCCQAFMRAAESIEVCLRSCG
jgi:hypothetical protein